MHLREWCASHEDGGDVMEVRTKGGDGEVKEVPGVGGAPEGGGGRAGNHLHALGVALALAHQEHREAGAQHARCHRQAQHQQQVACQPNPPCTWNLCVTLIRCP